MKVKILPKYLDSEPCYQNKPYFTFFIVWLNMTSWRQRFVEIELLLLLCLEHVKFIFQFYAIFIGMLVPFDWLSRISLNLKNSTVMWSEIM